MERSLETILQPHKSEKINLAHEKKQHKYSLEAVGILKKQLIKEEKYPIYKINRIHFNDDPDYKFETSQATDMVAVEMDQEGPDSPFQGVETYFDGSYLWCMSYKTLVV